MVGAGTGAGDGLDNLGYEAGEAEYEAASPDEKALVEACAGLGWRFLGVEQVV